MKRPLPTAEEARRILAAKRTRPVRKPPPPIGRRLNGLLKGLDERFGQAAGVVGGEAGLAQRWGEIAGEPLARISEPVRLIRPRRGGPATLEIRVAGPAAALVQHQSGAICDKVNLVLGAGAVDRLRIVQGPVAVRPAVKAPSGRRMRSPLDAAAEADLVQAIPDGPLKTALVRLGREILRSPSR